ncbi:MAG: succinate dehydrogenase, cytochrome b556 subunit [Beijerinckiaceae bacterium]
MRSLEARRPLSPHLSIYRMMLTMVMSGAHRITGIVLYLGTLLLVWYLVAAATDKKSFDLVAWVMGSFLGQVVLLGYTWALLHHLLGGIRHMIWDAGYGWEDPMRERLAQATLIGSVVLTIIIFGLAHLIH